MTEDRSIRIVRVVNGWTVHSDHVAQVSVAESEVALINLVRDWAKKGLPRHAAD